MILSMRLNNQQTSVLRFVMLFLGLMFFLEISRAQTPAEFQQYKDRYPSNPYIGIKDEALVEVLLDKQGKPILNIKEISTILILTDYCSNLSEVRSCYNGSVKIKKIEAYSMVPNGEKYTKIRVPIMKKTTEHDANNFFDDNYCMVGHFPAISKGVKLYEYNDYVSNEPCFGYWYFFGNSFPVESSVFSITYPENIKPIFRLAGKDTSLLKFTELKNGKTITCTWTCEKMKAYDSDKFAPDYRYYIPHISIQIAGYEHKGTSIPVMGTLQDLNRWEYSKLKNINKTIPLFVTHLADSITQGCTTSENKVKAIYRWVQDNIKYIAIEDGENGFIPQDAATVINRRYGDCKDKSSVITALLHCIGEQSSFACIGTRSLPYTFSAFPTIATTNHMIAIWWKNGNTPIPLDGTSRHLGIYNTPDFIQNKECLIMKDENNYLVHKIPINLPEQNVFKDTLHLQIDNKRLVGKGIVRLQATGKAMLMYNLEGKDSKQQNDVIVETLDFAKNKIELSAVDIKGISNPDDELEMRFEFSLPDYCVVSGDRLYVNLNLYQKLNDFVIKNDRSIPIESKNSFLQKITIQLQIPKGYTINELPKNSSYSNALFGYTTHYDTDGKIVTQHTELRIGFHVIEGTQMAEFYQMLQQLKHVYRQTVMFEKKKIIS